MVEGGDDLPIRCKERKRLEKLLQISKQEALALTDFILKYAFSIVEKVEHKTCTVEIDNTRPWAWNSVVGMLNEHSLVPAIWQLVCHNVDVWSCHASKKSTKKFVSKLLGSFLSLLKGNCTDVSFQLVEKQMVNEHKVVTMEETSSQLLRNSVLYEQQARIDIHALSLQMVLQTCNVSICLSLMLRSIYMFINLSYRYLAILYT